MKYDDLRRQIVKKGWYKKRQSGTSHAIYVHDEIKGMIILAVHGSKEVPTGLEKKIKKQAGL